MKSIWRLRLPAAALALILGPVTVAAAGTSAGWFDWSSCEMCAPMAAEKGLMENTKWESHAIATGMLSAVTVAPSHEAAFLRAHDKCKALGERLLNGEKLKLCGSCAAMSHLMAEGAKLDMVDAGGSHLMLLTATDPALVGRIQEYEKKNQAEMAKLEKAD